MGAGTLSGRVAVLAVDPALEEVPQARSAFGWRWTGFFFFSLFLRAISRKTCSLTLERTEL